MAAELAGFRTTLQVVVCSCESFVECILSLGRKVRGKNTKGVLSTRIRDSKHELTWYNLKIRD
jgi:hypothetical protein